MVVLLKDSWHIVSSSLRTEKEIYARLHKQKHKVLVKGDPRACHGDDICKENHPHQTAQTNQWLDPLKLDNFRTLRHYRIILEYFPYSLTTREMVVVLRDASIGT